MTTTTAELIEMWSELPQKERDQVVDYIEFLRSRASKEFAETSTERLDLKNSPFFGMWADRGDMSDSCEYVQKLRAQEWG